MQLFLLLSFLLLKQYRSLFKLWVYSLSERSSHVYIYIYKESMNLCVRMSKYDERVYILIYDT